jgi:translocation and assembly module TamB
MAARARLTVAVAAGAALWAGAAGAQISLLGLQNSLIQFALARISTPESFQITADGVREGEDGRSELAGVRVSDRRGAWLEIEAITLSWSPARILRGELQINSLAARGVRVLRRPDPASVDVEATEPAAGGDPFAWPRAPIATRIDEMRLDGVTVAPGVLAEPGLSFDALGSLRDEGAEQAATLRLRRTDAVAGRIELDYLRNFRDGTLRLDLLAEEAPGGVVAALAGFPPDRPSRVAVDAEGPLTDWAVTLSAEAGGAFLADGGATIDLGAPLAVDARLDVRPGDAAPPAATAVLGTGATLAVRAREGEGGVVRIEEGSIRSPALTAEAAGTFVRPTGAVDVDLTLDAGPDLAALAEGVEFGGLRFEGRVDGTPEDLTAAGDLALNGLATAAVDVGEARLDVDVTATGPRVAFDVAGFADRLRLDRLTAETLGRAELSAAGAWDGATRALALDRLDLASPLLTARASGRADLGSDAAAFDYAAEVADLSPVAAAYDSDAGGALRVEGALSGPLSAPRLTGAARATDLRLGDEALGAVTLDHDATLGATPQGRATLTADGSRYGPAAVATTFRLDGDRLALTDLSADALGVEARGAATVALGTGLTDGAIDARIADLGPASRLAGAPATGSATLRLSLTTPQDRQDAALDLTAEGLSAAGSRLDRAVIDADVTDALGPDAAAAIEATVAGLSGPGVAAESAVIEGTATGLRGSPAFDGRVALRAVEAAGGRIAELDAEGRGTDLTGAGAATLTATARGLRYDPAQAEIAEATVEATARDLTGALAVTGTARATDVAAAGARVAALDLTADLAGLTGSPGGTLRLTAQDAAYPAADARVAELTVDATGEDILGAGSVTAELSVRGLAAAGATADRLTAQARATDPTGAPAGTLTAALTGIGGAAATDRVALDARLSQAQGGARLDATLDAAPLTAGGATLGATRVTARVDDALGQAPRIDARAMVDGADAGGARLDAATASVAGPPSRLDLALDAAGADDRGAPLSLALRARADAAATPRTAVVSRLDAALGEAEASLNAPARLTLGDATALRGLDLSLPGGRLAGEAALHPDGLSTDLRLTLSDLGPLARLADAPVAGGALDAEASFDSRPGRARGRLRLDASDVALAGIADDAGALDVAASADWDGRRAEVEAIATGDFDQPVTLRAALPLRPTGGLLPAPPPGADIDGSLRWAGRIGELWALVPAADHVLDGDARVDLRVAGPATAPDVSGEVALSNGRYENLELGTILTDLSVGSRIEPDGGFALLAQANDGAGRPVRAQARLNDGTLDAQAVAERATLVRRDDVTAQVSFDVTARGPLAGPAVRGALTVDRAEVRLVNATPPSVADLGEVRIKGAPPPEPTEPAGGAVTLDLALRAPGGIFVRGRGLDSEWNMNLDVTGTAAAPVVTGSIERVRGVLSLAGFPFELETGFVRFFGRQPIDPDLEIGLVRENDGVRGGIWVRGPASAPEVTFESRPPLPEGEVLPRVLFGRSQQSLSPAQGVQLALGLATLLQGSGGPLDGVRSAVGLDVLRVEDDTFGEGGATVTAGENVADGVFVGARQPLDGGTARVVVEVEITPSVTVDTEIGQEEGSSVGVNWRRDF